MRFKLETRYPDYDTKGHVNNAVYLTYFEMARARAWLDVLQEPGDFSFVVAEANVKYVSQARIGDPLEIEMRTGEVRNKSWTWHYRITDPRDDRLVAEGWTVQVMYDYDARKSVAIAERLRERLPAV